MESVRNYNLDRELSTNEIRTKHGKPSYAGKFRLYVNKLSQCILQNQRFLILRKPDHISFLNYKKGLRGKKEPSIQRETP